MELEKREMPPIKKVITTGEQSVSLPGGLGDIANELVSQVPEVQDHAIAESEAQEQRAVDKYSHLRDADGNSFDPEIHRTNKEGEPSLSSKNKLLRKPGRKSGGSILSQIGNKVDPEAAKKAEMKVQARAVGKVAANTLITVGVALGGDEWQPIKNEEYGLDEKLALETVFADYFEATGKTDLPPGIALCVGLGAYALPRFTMPKTQTRMSRAKDWLSIKWLSWRGRKGEDAKLAKAVKKSEESKKSEAV